MLFNDLSNFHNQSYYLPNGNKVPYGIKQVEVKAALAANLPKIRDLPEGDLAEIKMLLNNSRNYRYHPIKVIPLRQFGYLETKTGKFIRFGIMGKRGFIDLDNDRVYFPRDFDPVR